jgi:hypothetical protein
MKSVPNLRSEPAFTLSHIASLAIACSLGVSGCSSSTTPDGTGGSGATTGGTSATGGTSGSGSAAGTGGTGPAAGAGGTSPTGGIGGTSPTGGASTGGSAGAGSAGAPTLVVDCGSTTYGAVLAANCSMIGCHRGPVPASGLNLLPDSGLVGRLKDVPAQHGDIFCADINNYCTTPPATCPAPGTALLVDSADYTKSWILTKLDTADPMCGDQMPGSPFQNAGDLTCIQNMVQAIAALPK